MSSYLINGGNYRFQEVSNPRTCQTLINDCTKKRYDAALRGLASIVAGVALAVLAFFLLPAYISFMSSQDAFYGASLGKKIFTPIIFLIIAPLALSGYGIHCLNKAIAYHRQISKGLAHKAELLSGKHGLANAKI